MVVVAVVVVGGAVVVVEVVLVEAEKKCSLTLRGRYHIPTLGASTSALGV